VEEDGGDEAEQDTDNVGSCLCRAKDVTEQSMMVRKTSLLGEGEIAGPVQSTKQRAMSRPGSLPSHPASPTHCVFCNYNVDGQKVCTGIFKLECLVMFPGK